MFLSGLGVNIGLFFSKLWDYLLPMIKHFLSDAGQALLPLAKEAVLEVAKDPSLLTSSGSAKREEAIARLKDKAVTAGIQVAEGFIVEQVQAAYDHLSAHSELPATNAPETASAAQ